MLGVSGAVSAWNAPVVELSLTLPGQTALITGASRGIGLAMAERFLAAGANVMLSSRKGGDLEQAMAGLVAGGADATKVAWKAAHVGDADQAKACVAETVERFGGLDVLVNNAGTNPYFGPLIDIDVPRAQKTFEVNQLAVVMWTSYAVKAGLRGSVINVASIGGLEVEAGIGWYNVTKAAVLHITRQLAYELAPDIRVNALAPGLVKTNLARALWEGPGEERVAAGIPLGRLGLPDDIATAALFLASDAASWITGQTLVVDGGITASP
jgi:NAD(P)-dependent dehydrogenase (short-subunit alcohol dehydrogenase family)